MSYLLSFIIRLKPEFVCAYVYVCHYSNSLIFPSSLGIYLSRYADLLQANPLEAGAVGDVVIFKIMKVILTFTFYI